MSGIDAELATGVTTLCNCWRVTRGDGVVLAFTDHDMALDFDGQVWRPNEGLSARAVEQTTGLAVDNSEATGALSDAGITEADIRAGRFDGARVEIWRVNWADPVNRALRFRGALGEIERAGGAFKAELRGLTEALNRPQGRLFQAPCSAVLGDGACGFDLDAEGYCAEVLVLENTGGALLVEAVDAAVAGWFDRGHLRVLDGAAAGQIVVLRRDRVEAAGRRLDLWEELPIAMVPGDRVRLEPGCDKRAATCRDKFANIENFRGFPHMPTEDFLMAYPVSGENA